MSHRITSTSPIFQPIDESRRSVNPMSTLFGEPELDDNNIDFPIDDTDIDLVDFSANPPSDADGLEPVAAVVVSISSLTLTQLGVPTSETGSLPSSPKSFTTKSLPEKSPTFDEAFLSSSPARHTQLNRILNPPTKDIRLGPAGTVLNLRPGVVMPDSPRPDGDNSSPLPKSSPTLLTRSPLGKSPISDGTSVTSSPPRHTQLNRILNPITRDVRISPTGTILNLRPGVEMPDSPRPDDTLSSPFPKSSPPSIRRSPLEKSPTLDETSLRSSPLRHAQLKRLEAPHANIRLSPTGTTNLRPGVEMPDSPRPDEDSSSPLPKSSPTLLARSPLGKSKVSKLVNSTLETAGSNGPDGSPRLLTPHPVGQSPATLGHLGTPSSLREKPLDIAPSRVRTLPSLPGKI